MYPAQLPKKKKINNILNYVVMFLVVSFGGVTFFTGSRSVFIICYLFLWAIFLFKQNAKFYSFKHSIIFILLILFLFVLQSTLFDDFNLLNLSGLIMNLTFGLAAILIIGPSFFNYYIKIIYIFSIISFVFVFISIFSPELYKYLSTLPAVLGTDPLKGSDDCLIIFNFEREKVLGIIRNPGPFYEAGAFACYLNLALILNSIKSKLNSKENIIFIIAILTTFSSAGYAILMFFLTTKIIISSKNRHFIKLVGAAIIFALSWQAYNNLPFLKEKLETQYSKQTEFYQSRSHVGRFGSALSDLTDLKGYFFTGRGLVKSSRFADEETLGSTNGTTDLLSRFGIIGFSLYLFLIFNSLRILYKPDKNAKFMALWFIGLILMIGFSQVILTKPKFLMLLYLQGFKKWIMYLNKSNSYTKSLI
jgi:hypothetical protein